MPRSSVTANATAEPNKKTMMRVITALSALCLSAVDALGQELVTAPSFPIVASGNRTRVGTAYHLNADCSPAGAISVRLAEKPKNGTVELVAEQGFSDYGRDAQQYKCNEKPSELQAFYYTSRDGFTGKDRFVVEVFYPIGTYRKRLFNVDVR